MDNQDEEAGNLRQASDRIAVLGNIPISSVEWDLLRVFQSLAEVRSTSLAASSLGISVPTLKRRLDRLEEILNSKLYTGDGTELNLTEFGRLVYFRISAASDVFNEFIELEKNKKIQKVKNIDIFAEAGAFYYIIKLFINKNDEFLRDYNISIKLKNNFEYSKNEKCDFYISSYAMNNKAIESNPVGFSRYVYVYSSEYAEKFGEPSLDDLSNHRFILAEKTLLSPTASQIALEMEYRSKTSIRIPTFVHAETLVREGLGFGLVNARGSKDGIFPLEGVPEVRSTVYLNTRKAFLEDPENRALYEAFLSYNREYFEYSSRS